MNRSSPTEDQNGRCSQKPRNRASARRTRTHLTNLPGGVGDGSGFAARLAMMFSVAVLKVFAFVPGAFLVFGFSVLWNISETSKQHLNGVSA
jgi:Na+-transporting NADH:ubiquinone oxidoreductase subunit NqrD